MPRARRRPSRIGMARLAAARLGVINVGLAQFADTIDGAGGRITRVDWSPPASGDRALGMALARVMGHEKVEQANAKAFERFVASAPVLRGVGVAREVLPGMGRRMLLHAGPPVAWRDMCGPMQGAIIG